MLFVPPPKKGQSPKRYPVGTDEWWFDLVNYMPARRTSNYKHKRFINKTYNKNLKSLDYLTFKAG